MNIAVIGAGYVGLVTAAVFAKFGNKVWAVDIDKEKIKNLKLKIIPFYEPSLKELASEGIDSKKLIFTSSFKKAIPDSQIVFICVGTPAKQNGDYDLSYVFEAVESIAKNIKDYIVIVVKSTVPPSTNQKVEKVIKKYTKAPFDLASCPEFLKEGSAVEDSLHPSRIVVGVESKKAKDLMLKLHEPIKAPRLICDVKSAQMIKYATNAFLATKISFINSIARLCDVAGVDIDKVAFGLGLDPRIGDKFLQAGLGYGGSCFPKDTWALIAYAKRLGYDFKFLKEVDQVNNDQIDYFVKKVKKVCGGKLKGKTLTVLGLSFKPETSDMREARSIPIIRKLQKIRAVVNVYDPAALDEAKKRLKKVNYFTNPYSALKGSSALLLITEWPEFKKLSFAKIGKIMKKKLVVDGRNFLEGGKLKKLGFTYEGIGRK